MTIITPTGIAGITSITSTGNTLQFQNASGNAVNVSGVNVTSGTDINVSGIVTASGFVGNVTGNVNSSGVSTLTTLRATSVVGVNTLGVTTAYVGSINDGPISGARNRIINGDMRIDQRNAGSSVTPTTNVYTLDRWLALCSASSKYSVQRNAGSVTPPTGFTNYFGVTSTSAYSSTANDFFLLNHYIEGFNIADFAFGTSSATAITLSFWIRSSLTGTFGISFCNLPADRTYVSSYTINTSNTWEYKKITVPGEISGSWGTNNGIGLQLRFDLGSGSNYNATAESWITTNSLRPSGSQSVVGTNGATWYITGVQLESGTVATPFERRSYGQELALCQRYYCQSTNSVAASSLYNQSDGVYLAAFNYSNASWVGGSTNFPVSMRTTPSTVNIYTTSPATTTTAGNASHYQAAISWGVSDASVHENTNERSLSIIAGGSGRGSTGGSLIQFNFTASAEL